MEEQEDADGLRGGRLSRRTLSLFVSLAENGLNHSGIDQLLFEADLEPEDDRKRNKKDKLLLLVRNQPNEANVRVISDYLADRDVFGRRDRGVLDEEVEALLHSLERDGWALQHEGLVRGGAPSSILESKPPLESQSSQTAEEEDEADEDVELAEDPDAAMSRRVFIVHGKDHSLKEAVARLVAQQGYDPIVLHEREDRGRTIIEKFVQEAEDAAFAIVLLTPDDLGASRDEIEVGKHMMEIPVDQMDGLFARIRPRARQNVVLELGYFIGALGRERVCALISETSIEEPSDYLGVLYVPVVNVEDTAWRYKLCKEMKAAGLDVDLGRI